MSAPSLFWLSTMLRVKPTTLTLVPVETNSARMLYSASMPLIDGPPLRVMRMNDLDASTGVLRVARFGCPCRRPQGRHARGRQRRAETGQSALHAGAFHGDH